MDDMNWSLPAGLESAMEDYYASSRPSPGFASGLDLELRRRFGDISLSSSGRMDRSLWKTLRGSPALAILLVLLALLLITGVAYAIGKLAGYIPGFGFTNDAQAVYLLDRPVGISEDGLTLQVEKAVSDSSRFWVEVTTQGQPQRLDFSRAFLILPDGEQIQFEMSGGTDLGNGLTRVTYSFPPVKDDLHNLILRIENPGGKIFSLPLELHPLRAGEMIPAQPVDTLPLQSAAHDGLALVLQNVAVTSDKTVLQVALHFDQPGVLLATDWNVILTDQDGKLYPLRNITPDLPNWAVVPVQPEAGGGQGTEPAPNVPDNATKLYETAPFTGDEKLILTLVAFPSSENLPMSIDFSLNTPGFNFDPGPNPQVGQTWALDQTLEVGHYTIHAIGVKLVSPTNLSFEFAPVVDVTGVMLYSPAASGADAGALSQSGNLTTVLTFEEIPAYPFQVKLYRVYYTAHGPWQINWRPPATPTQEGGKPTPIATASRVLPTMTPASPDSIQLEVQELARKFDAPLQQGPEWVHIVSETTTDPRARQTFPPPYLRTEQWYEIDREGFVTRSLWVDRDANGQVIQMSASIGNYSINFTTGDSGFNESTRYHISTDRESAFMQKTGSNVITREETTCDDGQPCLLITGSESFSQPMQNPGESEPFYGAGRRVWINLQTGEQVKTEAFWLLQDGTERVDYTYHSLLVEKVDAPPQAILDILSRVVVPER